MAKFLRLLSISILITGLVFLLYQAGFLKTIDARLTNVLYEQQSRHTGDVVVIKIDEKSLQSKEQGGLGRWQDWKREYFAQTVTNLRSAGAKVIGIDVFFSEPRGEMIADLITSFSEKTGISVPDATKISFSEGDDALLKSTLSAKNDIVLAAKAEETNNPIYPTRAVYDPALTRVASVSLSEDQDNIVRSIPLIIGEAELPYSFAFELTKTFLGVKANDIVIDDTSITLLKQSQKDITTGKNYGPIVLPLNEQKHLNINFRGTPFSIPQISFADIYNNTFDPASVRNKIVLIGEMDAGLHDDVYVPVSTSTAMPGVEVHANAIETILTNSTVQIPHPILQWGIVFILACITSCIGYFFRPRFSIPLALVVAFGYIVVCFLLFGQYHYLMSVWYPLIAIILSFIAVILYKYMGEERAKRKVVHAFSHYVSGELVSKIIQDPSMLKLGGERRELAISFTDIAGFTTLSEVLTPEDLTSFLHDYLHTMTEITLHEKGTLDKYIGDAIMSFWGAPFPLHDHAERAVRTALEMHRKLPEIRERWKHIPGLAELEIRTGIATGEVTVGNFGSHTRFDYTVIGDTVNLASRLEGANKVYETFICTDEETYLQTKASFLYRKLDTIQVKGKHKPVALYEVKGYRNEASVEDHELIHNFENALTLYQKGEFEDALKAFTHLYTTTQDSISKLYISRTSALLKNPPAGEWNGVFTMKDK